MSIRANNLRVKGSLGFSLVEALVALVILSISISLLTEWIGSAQRASVKVQQHLKLEDVLEQAILYLENEDFENRREGEFQIQEVLVSWSASVLKQSKDEPYRRQATWNVALFSVDLYFYIDNEEINAVNTSLVKQWRLREL